MTDWPKMLEDLLVCEFSKTPEEAARLVKTHTGVVLNWLMSGNNPGFTIRAAAMALEMAESKPPAEEAAK